MDEQAERTAVTSLRDKEKELTRVEGSQQRVAGGKTSWVRTVRDHGHPSGLRVSWSQGLLTCVLELLSVGELEGTESPRAGPGQLDAKHRAWTSYPTSSLRVLPGGLWMSLRG